MLCLSLLVLLKVLLLLLKVLVLKVLVVLLERVLLATVVELVLQLLSLDLELLLEKLDVLALDLLRKRTRLRRVRVLRVAEVVVRKRQFLRDDGLVDAVQLLEVLELLSLDLHLVVLLSDELIVQERCRRVRVDVGR